MKKSNPKIEALETQINEKEKEISEAKSATELVNLRNEYTRLKWKLQAQTGIQKPTVKKVVLSEYSTPKN